MTDVLVEDTIPFETFAIEARKVISPRKSRYGRMSFADIYKPGAKHEFIIDGVLAVGGVSAIAGPSQSGKSFLAIHAGMCIARNKPFFGHDVDRPGLVIYQAGEGQLGVLKRLQAYSIHEGIEPGTRLPFELLTARVDLFHPEADTKPLIEEIKWIQSEWPNLPLIAAFFDTLAAATPGYDENSGKDMGIVLDNVQRISEECKTHCCLIHHMNASGSKLRGHTSIVGNIEQIVTVTRNELTGVRTAVISKQKDEEDGAAFKFELMRIEVGATAKGKPITSCVCTPLGEKAAENEAKSLNWMRLAPQLHTAMIALVTAGKKHGRRPPDQIDCPIWAEAVTLTDWRNEYAKLKAGEEEDAEKLKERTKKARDRAVDQFLRHHLIGKSGDWVWRTKRKIFGIDHAPAEPKTIEMPPDLVDDLNRDDPLF